MTDQVNTEVTDTNTDPAPQATPREAEARAAGWVPKDEYNGDPNKWVDAEEFTRRGPLFEKINNQSRELKEVRKALDQLKAHHAQVEAASYKKALADLKAQKKEAFIDGDPDRILEIEEQIEVTKQKEQEFNAQRTAEVTAAAQEAAEQVVHPEFQEWTNRNSWYVSSKPMKAFADALGVDLRAQGMSPTQILREVEKQVKEEFPHKFRNANRDKPGAVEGAGKGTGKASGSSADYQLSEQERKIMKTFVRTGIMTEEQYIADLKKTKEA